MLIHLASRLAIHLDLPAIRSEGSSHNDLFVLSTSGGHQADCEKEAEFEKKRLVTSLSFIRILCSLVETPRAVS